MKSTRLTRPGGTESKPGTAIARSREATAEGRPPNFQIKQGTQPKEVHPMMNREQAIVYGKYIGVRWHIYNSNGCLVGDTKTLEQAQAMKRRFEIEERTNPWAHGKTRFEIREAK